MEYRLNDFLVDDSNEAAYSAIRKVIDNPRGVGVVCIWGQSGCGKTHLLRALKTELTEMSQELSIAYTRGDDFLDEYIESIRQSKATAFREKYFGLDGLIIDGIEAISGKIATWTEFQRLLYQAYEEGTSLIIGSALNPNFYENSQLITAGLVERIGKMQKSTLELIARKEIKKKFPKDKDDESVKQIADTIVAKQINGFNDNPRSVKGIARRVAFRSEEPNGELNVEKAKQSVGADYEMFATYVMAKITNKG
ncbi:MAG: ATP-binding protein [Lachnospiraceae bacterium]|nr:ATP-binding protein [Lachnospiraceae bacterium]